MQCWRPVDTPVFASGTPALTTRLVENFYQLKKNFASSPMAKTETSKSASHAARLATASGSVSTSFRSFSLYDTSIFATFFYSEIEKVWLIVVKNGGGFP